MQEKELKFILKPAINPTSEPIADKMTNKNYFVPVCPKPPPRS